MKRAGFLLLLFYLTIYLMTSCRSPRAIIKEPIKEEGPDYLFGQLKRNELQYDWFSAKFNIDYVFDKTKTSFNGQIRVKKDSIIWISFSPALGIEMARLMITNDSVKYLNRLNKTYFSGDYDFVSDFLDTNIDYDVLQSIILGNDFTYYENTRFKAAIDNMEYRLSTASRRKLKKYVKNYKDAERVLIQNIWLNPESFKITRMKIKEIGKENKKLDATYSDFEEAGDQLFPHHIDYELSAENSVYISVDYHKIEVNEIQKFPFRIPGKYDPIY